MLGLCEESALPGAHVWECGLRQSMLDAFTGEVNSSVDADALIITAASGAGLMLRAEQHP